MTLRIDERGPAPYAEVEVLDDGRLRAGTSGTGLGLLGIRERVASHRGECEIGPRATRGYRVRVRVPLAGAGDAWLTGRCGCCSPTTRHLVRTGFRVILAVEDDIEVVGEAGDGDEALRR